MIDSYYNLNDITVLKKTIYGGTSIEKGQIIFSKIFLIFKLKYLGNYLTDFDKNFFILILELSRINVKKILLGLIR